MTSISSPLRVLVITPTSKLGGTERNVALLARHLPKQVVRLSLATTFGTGDLVRRFHEEGLEAEEFRYAENPKRVMDLFAFARRIQPDIIHSFLLRGNWISWSIKRLRWARPVPWVASERGLDIGRPPWKARINRFFLSSADRVLAVSDPVRSILIQRDRLAPERLEVLSGGVEPPGEPLEPLDGWESLERPRVVTLSHLRPEKNVALSLRAFAAAVRDGRPGSLALIGDGIEKRPLEALASSLGISGRVLFCGNVVDARRRLRHFDLLLLPSKEEGFPNVILEAWQAGIPALSTDTPGAREISGDGGAAFLASDLEIPSRLRELMADEALRREGARKGAERVRDFSIDRVVERLLGIYRDVLNPG